MKRPEQLRQGQRAQHRLGSFSNPWRLSLLLSRALKDFLDFPDCRYSKPCTFDPALKNIEPLRPLGIMPRSLFFSLAITTHGNKD